VFDQDSRGAQRPAGKKQAPFEIKQLGVSDNHAVGSA
jgi:hypothetical protein